MRLCLGPLPYLYSHEHSIRAIAHGLRFDWTALRKSTSMSDGGSKTVEKPSSLQAYSTRPKLPGCTESVVQKKKGAHSRTWSVSALIRTGF